MLSQYLQRRTRLPFAGLASRDAATIPTSIASSVEGVTEHPDATFKDIIDFLPNASRGELLSVNDFVNEDGSLNRAGVEAALVDDESINIDAATLDSLIEDEPNDRRQSVRDYVDIVDDRRRALNAMGHDVDYRWQVATDSYTIISPEDAYNPAVRAFRNNGEGENIFGWADIKQYGGEVDIYILFTSQELDPPTTSDENDDSGPLYVGIQTGYNFSGGRAFDCQLFGIDSNTGSWMYNLGPRRSRRHVGDISAAHELEQDRTPIRDWWKTEYENILTYTDNLIQSISNAHSLSVDFTDKEYTASDFYQFLSLPEKYADPAGKTATKTTPAPTAWQMAMALFETLEDLYEAQDGAGDKHMSPTFRAHAEKASKLITNPEGQIAVAQNEFNRQQRETAEQAVQGDQKTLVADDIDEIDGVSATEAGTLIEQRRQVKQKQERLIDF